MKRHDGSAVLLALLITASVQADFLSDGGVTPRNGHTSTVFRFEVTYSDSTNCIPSQVQVALNDSSYWNMLPVNGLDSNTVDGKVYYWAGTLPEGQYHYRFLSAPPATGDVRRHWGPEVADVPLQIRSYYFLMECPPDPEIDDFDVEYESLMQAGGDLDGDGYDDLVYTWADAGVKENEKAGLAVLYFGPDYVRRTALLHPDYPGEGLLFGYTVAAGGDLDGDGIDDLAIASTGHVYIYHGRTSGVPERVQTIALANHAQVIAIADMNLDGYADLLAQEAHLDPSKPDHIRVWYGPALGSSGVHGFGGSVPNVFTCVTKPEVVDRNGDGYLDVVAQGGISGVPQIRSLDGPALGYVVAAPNFTNGAFFCKAGDVDGDGDDDFLVHPTILDPRSKLIAAPDMTDQGYIPLPASATNLWENHCAAGDVNADGKADIVVFQHDADRYPESGAYLVYSSNGVLNAVRFTQSYWVGEHFAHRDLPYVGCVGDGNGDGLADFFSADFGSSRAPLDGHIVMALGLVHVFSPRFPLRLNPADLPARYHGRMAGLTLTITNVTTDYGLVPNGSIDFIVGPPDSEGLSPVIIPAASFSAPDKTASTMPNGDPNVWRVEPAGPDGSGWMYVQGPREGDLQVRMEVKVSLVQLSTPETYLLTDTILLTFRTDPPLDFDTHYGLLKGSGRLPGFLASMGGYNSKMDLTMGGYVDWVQPTEKASFARVPAKVCFGSARTGTVSAAMQMALCNLGESNLTISSITAAVAPFAITNMPALPVTVPPMSSLSLWAVFAPTARGAFEQTLQIACNDPDHPADTVLLSGTGIGPGETDTDEDGMIDAYEGQYATPTDPTVPGLSSNTWDSHLDYDLDGHSNLEEFYAGMDPTDSNSVFAFTVAGGIPPLLKWKSADGKNYRVRGANAPNGVFLDLSGDLTGFAPTNSYTDTNAPAPGARIYRIDVDP